ncbi:DHA3 family tetracycline resistance protein-like MFS transporter [Kribbella pratensis]|uniref:DHA3 family tetracycline resistance protein-like MFS transporter n=1 Tax=Kribbella pratensis TaxID=2512112 RepID=A0ABY2FNJ3_9ACTN|nr:MFS transporter [Kribbella pratensis]TDW94693.1 DHA3 family tetracycline resistance protein-like MFS transporter [Kribbella pratensis]
MSSYRSADPTRTYYVYNAAWSFLAALSFTLNLVYYVRDAGLDPLQMVLVGTTLELTCFLFEIPTGIVADLYSRRLSIVIGFVLIGAGLLLQGLVPAFLAILAAQVLWGVGYTFTSGADRAWITDEIGTERVGGVFVRTQQFELAAKIAGTVTAGGLGLISLPLPMVISGAGTMLLGVLLALFMREQNFHRTPREERETFRQLADTFKHGLTVARRRPVVRTLVVISLIAGLSSEAFDRLWSVQLLTFSFPTVFGTSDPALWFTALALAGTALSLAASLLLNRFSAERLQASHPTGILATLASLDVLGMFLFAFAGNFWLALAALWLRQIADTVSIPIHSGWLNRHVDSRSRATVLSMVSQANAIGQVVGGPPLGALGRTSLRGALLASALIWLPIPALYLRLKDARSTTEKQAV